VGNAIGSTGVPAPAQPVAPTAGPSFYTGTFGGGGGFAGGGPGWGLAPGTPPGGTSHFGNNPYAPPGSGTTSTGRQEGLGNNLLWKYTDKGDLPPLKKDFFKPAEEWAQAGDNKGKAKETGKGEGRDQKPPPGEAEGEGPGKKEPAARPPQAEQPPAPAAPRKIIIRSGELEFEVESFDASVATVMKLVTATKGGFIATINSDKLANGKVRGSIVVRVPPDQLDKFVLDLRKELGETGELKNQRIGSQDITKQYTDLESRLRAARTMEDRLLKIIQEGKGQIKDLLQAEKELGVWRTKIEEFEGELRYYSNLVSLSTLTINLHEKNIRTAAAVTENEHIQAGIEVEDVEKAQQEALKAVTEAKGRVTRAELKQHAAGQFNAILHFEVTPESAGTIQDRLKQLGTMVRLQIDRVQQTEGGGPAPRDGKVERGNTQFQVSLYNLANVAPRETVVLRIAVADVPAVYQKLRGAVAKAEGRVINAQLNEQDRQNITAQLDFDVRRVGEGTVLADFAAAGETLSRQVSRVPEADNVTDAKVLYRVTLVDADSIQPRETVAMSIAATDVPAAYQKLRDALAKAKARVYTAQLNEQDRRNITAQLDFTFRRADEATLQAALKAAGETLSRQVTRLPESATVTDAKVLAKVVLVDAGALPPRETVTVKIAAPDVPAAYEKLRAAVAAAKGRVVNAQLNEQDRRNVTAQLVFDIPRSQEGALQAALAGAGEALERQVARQQEAGNVTDTKVGFRVDLTAAANIMPRETRTLALEVSDVPGTLAVFTAQVKEAQGRTVKTQVGLEKNGQVTARVVFDVPLSAAASLAEKFKAAGHVRVDEVSEDPAAPEGRLALGRLVVTLSNTPLLVPTDQGLWSQIRGGLAFSLRGLSISASWLVVGLLFVLPWLLVLYVVLLLVRRWWRGAAVPATAGPSGNVPAPPAG
jgi:hypothetical protein